MIADSNIIIYAAQRHTDTGWRQLLRDYQVAASIVSLVEALGYQNLPDEERLTLEEIFRIIDVLPLTREIADRAAKLRQQRRMGLGDAIIAATALDHNMTLITRNTRDFRWITNLRLLNPLEEQEQLNT